MILNAVSVVVLTWDLSLIFFIVQQKAKKKLLNYKRNLWKIKEKNTFQVMDIEWMTRRLFWEKIKLSALINWYTEVFIKNEVFTFPVNISTTLNARTECDRCLRRNSCQKTQVKYCRKFKYCHFIVYTRNYNWTFDFFNVQKA